jgi:hypothetical protein
MHDTGRLISALFSRRAERPGLRTCAHRLVVREGILSCPRTRCSVLVMPTGGENARPITSSASSSTLLRGGGTHAFFFLAVDPETVAHRQRAAQHPGKAAILQDRKETGYLPLA